MGLFSLLPGVEIVKLRFEGRRLGGVGGLMKEGEGGAEIFFSFFSIIGSDAVGFDRRLLSEVEVLIPRFFRFRGFFAGVVGLCNSKNVLAVESMEPFSVLRDRKSATKDEGAALAMGDSGEGPGDGSVTEEESMVDIVVVGELSEDAVEVLSRLSRWIWKEEKGTPLWGFPLDAGRAIGPCALLACASERSLRWVLCVSSPNTEPKDGIGANDRGLVCMLGRRALAGDPDLGERLAVLRGQRGGLGA